MNKELQRTTIAEVCGWSDVRPVRIFGSSSLVLRGYRHFLNAGVQVSIKEDIPDYLNDHNAMHEALKLLVTDDQKRRFVDHLSNINNGGNGALRWWGRWACASATAAQEAEAFLRTFNLWVD